MKKKLIFISIIILSLSTCIEVTPTGSSDNSSNNDPIQQIPDTPHLYNLTELIDEPRRGLRISFNLNGGNADKFILQRKVPGGTFIDYANLGPSTNSDYDAYYDDWDVQMSEYYNYRVCAQNGAGNSNWSSERGKYAPGPQTRELAMAVATADTYVDEGDPNKNFGSQNTFLVTKSSSMYGMERKAYIKFPLNGIPSYAIGVDLAEIRIFSDSGIGTPTVHLKRSTSSWSESNISWNNKPNITSYVLAMNQNVRNDGTPQYWEITQEVGWWLDGTNQNYGIVIESASPSGSARFISKEHASAVRPSIRIVYEW